MDRLGIRTPKLVVGVLGLLALAPYPPARAVEGPRSLPAGPVLIFADGYESDECELWSSSSNPLGAPDLDLDEFGDEQQPTVYCSLPGGYVSDTTDCDDLDDQIHPGAPEICNGVDDDCEPLTLDGDDDPQVGQDCDGPDGDLCEEGVVECVLGGLSCSDDTPTNVEVCNNVDDDCDGTTDEDIFPDTNPACNQFTDLGSVAGDEPGQPVTAFSFDEQWYLVEIREDNSLPTEDLTARVTLQSPADANFDLFVRCLNCSDPRILSSTNGVGQLDTVFLGRDDLMGSDQTFTIVVEVRFVSWTLCGFWNLAVTGNLPTADRTCN